MCNAEIRVISISITSNIYRNLEFSWPNGMNHPSEKHWIPRANKAGTGVGSIKKSEM